MTDFEALKEQYNNMKELCSTAVELYEDAEELVDDFPNQIMILVLRVWSAQPGYHEEYNRALKVINERMEISERIFDELIKNAGEVPFIPIMKQFAHMAVAEAVVERPFCGLFMATLIEFLTDMAFINGDCTPEEANEIEQIRMMHMDFYNEFNITRRRVKSGAVPAGTFKYDRYGIEAEWRLNADGTVDFDGTDYNGTGFDGSDYNGTGFETSAEASAETSAEDGKPAIRGNETGTQESEGETGIQESKGQRHENDGEPGEKYFAGSRLPDHLFRVDMRAAKAFGLTDIKVHGWWQNGWIVIIGQMYADKGLKEDFTLTANIFDRDGDLVDQLSNVGYGGGSIKTAAVRRQSFFQGYPFEFSPLSSVKETDDISEIRITFNS